MSSLTTADNLSAALTHPLGLCYRFAESVELTVISANPRELNAREHDWREDEARTKPPRETSKRHYSRIDRLTIEPPNDIDITSLRRRSRHCDESWITAIEWSIIEPPFPASKTFPVRASLISLEEERGDSFRALIARNDSGNDASMMPSQWDKSIDRRFLAVVDLWERDPDTTMLSRAWNFVRTRRRYQQMQFTARRKPGGGEGRERERERGVAQSVALR